jgi:hypothetical protein
MLRPISSLTAGEEEENRPDNDDCAFPADGLVLDDGMVEHGDIQSWERRDGTSDDGPEQGVTSAVVPPGREDMVPAVAGAPRIPAAERPADADYFPMRGRARTRAGRRR